MWAIIWTYVSEQHDPLTKNIHSAGTDVAGICNIDFAPLNKQGYAFWLSFHHCNILTFSFSVLVILTLNFNATNSHNVHEVYRESISEVYYLNEGEEVIEQDVLLMIPHS